MSSSLAALCRSTQEDAAFSAWKPLFFTLPTDEAALSRLIAQGEARTAHDTLEEQLDDLAAARHPKGFSSPEARAAAKDALRGGVAPEHFGVWVFYPWNKSLVRLLPAPLFRELRSDRNRLKISRAEQETLHRARVGVVGLSVGQAAAVTLALEGIGGQFRLADFDTLGLSNLNRLRASVRDLGVSKAQIAARAMFEIDPYLEIEIYERGLSEENLDAFLGGPSPLSVVIEECDDLVVKVALRERARALRLPVLMETSDRGMLDIERFDREPERPLFHGLLGGMSAAAMRAMPPEARVPLVARIVGESPSISARASLIEVRESISTWPQLASSISLGAGVVSDAARRVLLGGLETSGRLFVDLDELFAVRAPLRLSAPSVESHSVPPVLPARPAPGKGTPTRDELHFLVSCAVLAPSGGNVQPWKFVAGESSLRCEIDPARSSFLDFDYSASRVAVGAAIEHIHIAAEALGLRCEIEVGDSALWVATLHFQRGTPVDSPLLGLLPLRCTNRRRGDGRPISPDDQRALSLAAEQAGARLSLLSSPREQLALGVALGEADRLRYFSPQMHREMNDELRMTPEEVLSTRDGIDLLSLELPPAGDAILKFLSDRAVIERLQTCGVGRGLGRPAQMLFASAGGAGLLSVEGSGPAAHLHGGRALARLWLAATQRGLALCPWSPMIYLVARLEAGGEGLSQEERETLSALAREYRGLFGVSAPGTEVLLFRLAYAPPPSARSLRRPVEEVLRFSSHGS